MRSFVTRLVKPGTLPPRATEGSVRLIRDREAQLAALDAVIERAAGESEAAKGKPADEVFDRLDAKYRAMAAEAK